MKIFSLLFTLLVCLHSTAALSEALASKPVTKPAKVMLFGSFHFSNPGLDYVKNKQIDVTIEENQTYLINLSKRIANEFKPTAVLLECDPKQQAVITQNFNKYLNGNYELRVNESNQIGFRVAKEAKIEKVVCFDERNVQWQAEALMKSMPESNPEIHADFQTLIASLTSEIEGWHKQGSLSGVLKKLNQREYEDKNKSLYILTNGVGAGDNFAGADAAASWWHRNFRMYANIQKAAATNNRVLVIAGHGHTSVLRDFIALDKNVIQVDTLDIL